MNSVLKRLIENGTMPGPAGEPMTLHHPEFPGALSHIDDETGGLLQRAIHDVQPQLTLEIGFAYGVSTLYICDALASLPHPARHIVLDPYQHGKWQGLGIRNVAEAGYSSMVDFHAEPSELALPRLLATGVTLDLAFIDGLHRFDQVMTEFFYINRLLRTGGIVLFDDANRRSVSRAVRHALTYPAYEVYGAVGVPRSQRTWRATVRDRLGAVPVVQSLIRQDRLRPDWALGIGGRCVALRKIQQDDRHTYFDEDF